MTWTHYFECFGVILVIYAVVRLIIAWELKADKHWKDVPAGTPIDTSQISERVEAVRRREPASMSPEPHPFKKPRLVEEKRRQMEKRAYFNRPPPPEPPAHEEGHGTLIFI